MTDRPPPQPPPPERPEDFVAKDRAKRFVFRLQALAKERSSFYASERIGMTSFAEAVPVMLAIAEDLRATIDAVLAGRLRDRERGPIEIPFVVAAEGVLERLERARRLEERRRATRISAEWAQRRVLGLLADAVRRLDAFATVYEDERILPVPETTDVTHVLLRVEEDAAIDRLPSVPTEPPGLRARPTDRPAPPLVTCADALEDLLRAARAEVSALPPPWRVVRTSPTAPLLLSLGAGDPDAAALDDAPATGVLLGPDPREARTDRAAAVLSFATRARVVRVRDRDGATAAVHVTLADATAAAVGERVPTDVPLAPAVDAAVRAYVVASAKEADPMAPTRLLATMGVLKAVERELERVLGPALERSEAKVTATQVPRESSRKAPVRREVIAALEAAIPGFPGHRVTEVLDAVALGKPGKDAVRPPDAAVVLAVLGRRWPMAKGFGDRALPLGPLTDEDVLGAVRDVVDLASLRQALDRGRDPGPDGPARFEAAAFGLLRRLARIATA